MVPVLLPRRRETIQRLCKCVTGRELLKTAALASS